ncbi:MAG: 16S rRNA (cytosine(1402)-N(4))-methyltransferase RsmH [bacterium]|nr:16S rRNA (cytosine(1402)-N(4))-methyltransferase RsmH [bacterium]
MSPQHIPVLLNEVIENLQPQANQNFIDCTLGGGGHSQAILNKTSPNGKLLAIDLNEETFIEARKNLNKYKDRIIFSRENFSKLKQIYNEQFSLYKIDGILLDLGFSSLELEDKDRGFSFQIDGPLDMRYDKRQSLTAEEIVNTWSFDNLKKVIQEYGQERLAQNITKKIIKSRLNQKITKTKILVEAILLAFRDKLNTNKEIPWIGGIHPATRTFQALRIAVNDEINNLKKVLPQAIDLLEPGARLAVISFHSLEDKIVKNYFRTESRDCLCPPEAVICICGHQAKIKLITKKPIKPTEEEIKTNPRARSAVLRVVEKTKQNDKTE